MKRGLRSALSNQPLSSSLGLPSNPGLQGPLFQHLNITYMIPKQSRLILDTMDEFDQPHTSKQKAKCIKADLFCECDFGHIFYGFISSKVKATEKEFFP